jgi:hypothetical protein
MKYVIEVRRPSFAEPKRFAELLDKHVRFMKEYPGPQFEVFETELVRQYTLEEVPANKLIRVMTIDPTNCVSGVRYIDADIDADNDAYFVSIDIPDEYIDEMNGGRGRFIVRALYQSKDSSSQDDICTDVPKESMRIPVRIIALDYVKKGGQ